MKTHKIIATVLIVLIAFLVGVFAVVYFETNLIPPLHLHGGNQIVLKFAGTSMEPTIKEGNYVLVDKSINPADLNTNYPNSDIIAFQSPYSSEIIVHRIISKEVSNGVIYFLTKGDNNGTPYPLLPQTGLDPWDNSKPQGIPQSLVIGRVVDTNYK